MIIIELSTAEKAPQYARKPFFVVPLRHSSFDIGAVPSTYIKADAKQFKTVRQAHVWLARRGFMRRSQKAVYATGYTSTGVTMPEPFLGFELLSLDTTED